MNEYIPYLFIYIANSLFRYLDSYYTFLPQSKIVALGAKVAKNELRAKPNTLIICGTYTIGKERVFIGEYQFFS